MSKVFLALIATSVVFLGGCTPSEPTYTPPVVATPELPSNEELFIATIEKQFGPADAVTESNLIEFGKIVCNLAPMWDAVIQAGIDGGLDGESVAFIVGASVPAFCPQYLPQLYTYIDSLNALGVS